jgi:protein transport protein SEC24
MPSLINLTSERIERNGIYVLDNTQEIFLYIGKAVTSDQIHALFGVSSFEAIPEGKVATRFFIFMSMAYLLISY